MEERGTERMKQKKGQKGKEETQNERMEESSSPTPRSRVLLENLTVTQLVKKFPTFYGTSKFITVFTKAHQCSLS
jgi:hypothetical protein